MKTENHNEDAPRYRAVLMEDDNGKWFAGIVLFENLFMELSECDTCIEDWCAHRHRSKKAAKRCLPLMRKVARSLNKSLLEVLK